MLYDLHLGRDSGHIPKYHAQAFHPVLVKNRYIHAVVSPGGLAGEYRDHLPPVGRAAMNLDAVIVALLQFGQPGRILDVDLRHGCAGGNGSRLLLLVGKEDAKRGSHHRGDQNDDAQGNQKHHAAHGAYQGMKQGSGRVGYGLRCFLPKAGRCLCGLPRLGNGELLSALLRGFGRFRLCRPCRSGCPYCLCLFCRPGRRRCGLPGLDGRFMVRRLFPDGRRRAGWLARLCQPAGGFLSSKLYARSRPSPPDASHSLCACIGRGRRVIHGTGKGRVLSHAGGALLDGLRFLLFHGGLLHPVAGAGRLGAVRYGRRRLCCARRVLCFLRALSGLFACLPPGLIQPLSRAARLIFNNRNGLLRVVLCLFHRR